VAIGLSDNPKYSSILSCVVSIINQQGESGVRIDDVVRATGVSTATIYRFFSSREGLIAAAQAERYATSLTDFISRAVDSLKDVSTKQEF
jgi:AcrR family transcriptional regulator